MKIQRSFIAALVLGCLIALPATSFSQDKPDTDQKEQVQIPIDVEKEFNIPFWTELLDLKDHQIQFMEIIQTEMKERLESEAAEFGEDPEFLKQLANDVLTESRERIRETLNGKQLIEYEKYMAKEKQRRAELEHPEDNAEPTDDPGDTDHPNN